MLLTRARIASIKVPNIRNGIDSSQNTGQSINTRNATGQQRTNRIDQSISVNSIFIVVIQNNICNK